MIANYTSEIKILIFQSVSKCQCDEWKFTVKINSLNFESIGRKFTKFVHDVAGLLPFTIFKADLRLANPLSNAKA